ncbi:DNA repair protein RAD7, partial [Phenoliferia sp. Uapishka_3]
MPPRRANQPADASRSGQITGPTSALTSFLREQGITGNIHRRPQPPTPTAPTSDPASDPTNANADASGSGTRTTTVTIQVEATTSKRKGGPTKGAAAKKQKKAAGSEGDGGFEIAGVTEGPKPGRYDKRAPGSIAMCGECGKKFTITKYTASNPLGKGLLCHPCSNESIETVSAAATPKPKAPKRRASKAVDERVFKPVRTLQQACIAVIGNQINNVVALGDIGPKNLDRIAKIVAKHRALTHDNLELFLDIGHTQLSLYDCTNIPDEDLASIASFCPHLERLTLKMCGRLDDSVLIKWASGFKKLKYLSLYAPYLVTAKGWADYFSSFNEEHSLEGFGIRQSARMNDEALQLLVTHCPDLYNLQLSEIGKLTDLSLGILHPLTNLTSLDISRSGFPEGDSLTTEGVVALLAAVGENLVELVLDQNYNLGDDVLVLGIKPHCRHLRSLSLSHLADLTPEGFSTLFDLWPLNSGLSHLSIHRCTSLTSSSLRSLLAHSAHSLESLNLHSVDEIEQDDLFQLAKDTKGLVTLDVSFVRAVDNFVVKAFQDGLPHLTTLFCHGNNRVTDDCPQKRGLSIRGLENCLNVEL